MLKNMQLKRKKKHYSTVEKDESAPDLLLFNIQKIFLRKKSKGTNGHSMFPFMCFTRGYTFLQMHQLSLEIYTKQGQICHCCNTFFFFFTVWSFTYNFKFCILTRILPLSSRSVFQMPDFQLPQPNPPAFLTDTFNLVNTKLGSWSSPQNLSSSRAPTTVNSTIPSVAQAQSLSCSLLLPLPSSTSSHQSNGCFLFFASTSAHLQRQCPKPSNPRLSLAFPWH